jgi:hypothetical protein
MERPADLVRSANALLARPQSPETRAELAAILFRLKRERALRDWAERPKGAR